MHGADTELDRPGARLIKDPLNICAQLPDHGLETPPSAPAAGKPEQAPSVCPLS